jgi:hypothetical protein
MCLLHLLYLSLWLGLGQHLPLPMCRRFQFALFIRLFYSCPREFFALLLMIRL